MPRSLALLLRDAYDFVDTEVQTALAGGGYPELTRGHHTVLRHLGADGARPSELAAHADVSRQAITKVVDELERLGVVERRPDPADGRSVVVHYTERGRQGLEVARRRMLSLEAEFGQRLGAEQWGLVRTALETLFGAGPVAPGA